MKLGGFRNWGPRVALVLVVGLRLGDTKIIGVRYFVQSSGKGLLGITVEIPLQMLNKWLNAFPAEDGLLA